MTKTIPYTEAELATLKAFADTGEKTTIAALEALGLNRTHQSMRVKITAMTRPKLFKRVNVTDNQNKLHAAILANPQADAMRLARIVDVSTKVVYSYARKFGGLKTMQAQAETLLKDKRMLRAAKCRYFQTSTMSECGAASHGRTYCEAHQKATMPHSTRAIDSVRISEAA